MLSTILCQQYNNRKPGLDSLSTIEASFVMPILDLKTDPSILSILNSKNIKVANRSVSILVS